jgi:hypothetical protein
VSTILEALRKLQGDRDGIQAPARDLRTSVLDTAALPPLRKKSSERSVRPIIAALGGGALMAGGIGLYVLWSDREVDPFERAAATEMPDPMQVAQAEMPYDAPVELPAPDPQSAPLVNMAAPPEPPPTPAPQYTPPVFDSTSAHPDPDPPAPSASQPWFTPPDTFAPVLDRARPRSDADPSMPSPGSDPAYALPPKYDPPQIVTRTQGQESSDPAALDAAVARARARLNAREPEPRREQPSRDAELATAQEAPSAPAASGLGFPSLQVQSVLWHPDPLRRQATILLDGQLATDAREGDLIGGVFIDRIQPGSVDFRMGQERKRIDMAP